MIIEQREDGMSHFPSDLFISFTLAHPSIICPATPPSLFVVLFFLLKSAVLL